MDSLITLEHFAEMIRFEEFVTTVETPPELLEGLTVDKVTLGGNICEKGNITSDIVEEFAARECQYDERFCLPPIEPSCKVSSRPIDFVYNRRTNTFDLSQFDSDLDLIRQV